MGADKLLPCGALPTFRSRWDPIALEDIANGLVANTIAQMHQSSGNTIVAPRAIFLGHAQDQILEGLIDLRSPERLAVPGAVELLCHQLAVPGQNRLGFDNGRDLCQRLLTQLLTNLS
jgi:hypothetical protein